MFNKNFYPTPNSLAHKLISPYNLDGACVLEPEAGKGDLCDAIVQRTKHSSKTAPSIYCCEIEPDLQAVLRDKGYPIVGADFLEYTPMRHYTHIFMNPPFDHCEEHLLHAWNILYAGHIACILPRHALEGKFANERVLLHLLETYGSVEDCGRAFASGSDRYMGDDVVIVRLEKKPQAGIDLDFQPTNDQERATFDEDDKGQELALRNFIENLLAFYTASTDAYEAYNLARQKIVRYTAPLASFYRPESEVRRGDRSSIDVLADTDKLPGLNERYNTFIDLLTESAWSKVLDHPGFSAIMTNRTKEALLKFRREQKRVDFNRENIQRFLETLVSKEQDLLMGAVLDSFDIMTKYSEESKEAVEGWKSNDAYKVNKRVVLPGFIDAFERYHDHFSLNSYHYSELDDIDRGLCLVAGRRFDSVLTIRAALQSAWRGPSGNGYCSTPGECHSEFFKIRFYKKGTIHLYWLDDNLRRDFNIRAAQGRGWLAPDTSARHAPKPADRTARAPQPQRGAVTGLELAL